VKKTFGRLSTGEQAYLYTISCGELTATVSDYGAHLVSLLVPDANGVKEDVVLGFDNAESYRTANGGFLGATVGRNANRIGGSSFLLGDTRVRLKPNEGPNNLHSGPDHFHTRFWQVVDYAENSITLRLDSPAGDQGFPGKAVIKVTYALEADRALHIRYDAVADRDTVFNMTNHSYFNLAGHKNVDAAIHQELIIPGRWFNPDDAANIPTGELRSVEGTPFDFRQSKPISRDIGENYEPLILQGGYDHNFEVFCNPCAILSDPASGRTMSVHTDCPGIQLYAGNFLNENGKEGVYYGKRSGIALETQYYPNSVNHPEWPQPFTKAGQHYKSETVYKFSW
jgi:aldose 1-epimerase